MAKRKPARSKKTAAGRKAVRKPVRRNPPPRARAVPRNKNPRAAKPARAAQPSRTAKPVDVEPSLGRPKVTGEEDLDLFFKDDYHARQIFRFLNVRSLKELERFSAAEILRRLSNPIKETVERVRRLLARNNRCLNGDEEFALEHKEEMARILKGDGNPFATSK
ncbi:MAG: hypothetical protein HY290_22570 [Planctomycetia bacterium]|nr:hypothetical protein [Planctomycetia bacterium]